MKKKTEQTIELSKTPIKVLTETELLQIKGGATEELFGAYHFLLEVTGV